MDGIGGDLKIWEFGFEKKIDKQKMLLGFGAVVRA